jgi:hypothetical protein
MHLSRNNSSGSATFCQAEIVDLLIEMRKLSKEVNGKAFLFPVVLLPKAFSFLTWLMCDWSAIDDKLGQEVANRWCQTRDYGTVYIM